MREPFDSTVKTADRLGNKRVDLALFLRVKGAESTYTPPLAAGQPDYSSSSGSTVSPLGLPTSRTRFVAFQSKVQPAGRACPRTI